MKQGKTLRLTSIVLALMMFFGMFAVLLVPSGAAGAAPLVTITFPPTSLSAKDTNNVVPAPDGPTGHIGSTITFQIKVKDYDYELTDYEGVIIELLDPLGDPVPGYTLSSKHKMTKVDDTTYTYNVTVNWHDRAFYDQQSNAYIEPRTGMYSAKLYPYRGNDALIGGSHNLAAFWFAKYVAPNQAITETFDAHKDQKLPIGDVSYEESSYWWAENTNQKHYVGPNGIINVSYSEATKLNAGGTYTRFKFGSKGEVRLVNPFTDQAITKYEFDSVTLNKTHFSTNTNNAFENQDINVPSDVVHNDRYMLPLLVIDSIGTYGFKNTYMTVPGTCSDMIPDPIDPLNKYVTIDAKGPEIGETVFSNDHWNGRKWNDDYVFLNSGSAMWGPVNAGTPAPASDQNFVEVRQITDADSGFDASYSGSVDIGRRFKNNGTNWYVVGATSENFNTAYVKFTSKYHESLNYGSTETTQLALPYDYKIYAWYCTDAQFKATAARPTSTEIVANYDGTNATLGTHTVVRVDTSKNIKIENRYKNFMGYQYVRNTKEPVKSWVPYFSDQGVDISKDEVMYMHITGNVGLVNALKDNEMEATVVAVDRCGNKTEKSAGSKKFYEKFDAIKETRMESQNVLYMYVGQTLTKDDIARQNIKVWNTGWYSANASLPNDWHWYVSLGSENLLDFDIKTETITAKKSGEAKIYAKPFGHYNLGGYSEWFHEYQHDDYTKVIITDEPTVKSVKLSSTSLELNVGSTHKLSATTDPASMPITWETSDAAIATVDEEGLVTGVAAGSATIYAKSGGAVDVCTVTVIGPKDATAIKLSDSTLELNPGQGVTLTATLTPADSTTQVNWNTSNAGVATVDNAGKVTAIAAGTTTITATAGSVSATCTVTVVEPAGVDDRNGWVEENGNKYYYVNGKAHVGWRQINGEWYFFDYSNGIMVHGRWLKEGGKWYYLNENGTMKNFEWYKEGGNWYWFKNTGSMVQGWEKIAGTWYFFDDVGRMKTGWINVRGIWYYMKASGAMYEGWLELPAGTWYYLTPGGGAMVTGRVSINGRQSDFAASGRWLGYVK